MQDSVCGECSAGDRHINPKQTRQVSREESNAARRGRQGGYARQRLAAYGNADPLQCASVAQGIQVTQCVEHTACSSYRLFEKMCGGWLQPKWHRHALAVHDTPLYFRCSTCEAVSGPPPPPGYPAA